MAHGFQPTRAVSHTWGRTVGENGDGDGAEGKRISFRKLSHMYDRVVRDLLLEDVDRGGE